MNEKHAENNNKAYTVDEIAKILNVCNRTVYNMIRSNKSSYVRVGRLIRVPKISFDDWYKNKY